MTNDRYSPVPPWLSNPELVAPCMCGEPFDEDVPYAIVEDSDTGLQRWWHAPCFYSWMQQYGSQD